MTCDECVEKTEDGEMVSYSEKYGALLRGISDEADKMSLECFRNSSLQLVHHLFLTQGLRQGE